MHEFSVEMTCEGCANAVTNVLNKKEGMVQWLLYILIIRFISYLNLKVALSFLSKHVIINFKL